MTATPAERAAAEAELERRVARTNTLASLRDVTRELAELEAKADAARKDRDNLIRQALRAGASLRGAAAAAGVSHTQIAHVRDAGA
jgi:hypothetical protein